MGGSVERDRSAYVREPTHWHTPTPTHPYSLPREAGVDKQHTHAHTLQTTTAKTLSGSKKNCSILFCSAF